MPTSCISPALAEMVAALVVLAIVVTALSLMIRIVSLGQALRNLILVTCLLLVLAALFGILLHLWENMGLIEKAGIAIAGIALTKWALQGWCASRKVKSKHEN